MRVPIIVVVFSFVLVACDSGPAVTPPDPCRSLVAPAEPRINWGEGVEGIRLGQPRTDVQALLGEPDGVGYIDLRGTGQVLYWNEGNLSGLSMVLWYRPNGIESVAMIFLNGLSLSGAVDYSGQTAEGIGIGSTRQEVACVYGAIGTAESVSLTVGSVRHVVFFEDDRVQMIYMIDQEWIDVTRGSATSAERLLTLPTNAPPTGGASGREAGRR